MGNLVEVQVPDIGDYQGVPVIELLVKDGDTVAKDQALIVLESEKSTMEVPAPSAGTVRGLKVKVGDKLSKGDRICRLEKPGDEKGETGDESKPAPAQLAAVPAKPGKTPDLFTAATPGPTPSAATENRLPSSPTPRDSISRLPVVVPDIGDYQGVPIIELLVKDGDSVARDQALMVLESEKSTMEVPAPNAGTVRGLKVKLGDKVSKGDALLDLETPGEGIEFCGAKEETGDVKALTPAPVTPEPDDAKSPQLSAAKPAPAVVVETASPSPGAHAHAGPATRKFARELGVDLAKVGGSGPKGRVVIEDVQQFVKRQMTSSPASSFAPQNSIPSPGGSGIPPIPAQDFSLYGEIETQPLARIRKLSAAHLTRAWLNIPHVTQTDEADITELEAFRKSASEEGGVKLTLLCFMMKAVSLAIRQYPEFGSSLAPDGASLILKKYCHVGFAADTPNGLVVPVVRDVWGKSLTQLATESAELAKKARDGKLKPDEMKGGCFSISSLGGIGGSHFTPIVNAPEVAILGVSRGVMKPVWDGKAFQPRLMVPLSLSYDHRVIDGAAAARFIVKLVTLLADIRRLSL